MTSHEIVSFLGDKTEIWDNGAAYYAPDGTLVGHWNDEPIEGEWWSDEDGVLCTDVQAFGGELCWEYWRQGDKVLYKWKGEYGEYEYKSGNQI